jgi:hypothetical protein
MTETNDSLKELIDMLIKDEEQRKIMYMILEDKSPEFIIEHMINEKGDNQC